MNRNRKRRMIAGVALLLLAAALIFVSTGNYRSTESGGKTKTSRYQLAIDALETLEVKGRAPLTGYQRLQFGKGWSNDNGCDTRNRILLRDLIDTKIDDQCRVLSGVLHDPYTGKKIYFVRGSGTSSAVQIDHVVALSDAWQKGAQQMSLSERIAFANDPLELIAVSGEANEQKSGSDAASWLPPYKPFRCQYVARQIAIKLKYKLWVTLAERDAMKRVLGGCPEQRLPQAS